MPRKRCYMVGERGARAHRHDFDAMFRDPEPPPPEPPPVSRHLSGAPDEPPQLKIPAYTKPIRFSTLLRDIRREAKVTRLSVDLKAALTAVIDATAGSTVRDNRWSDVEMARVEALLDRLRS